MKNVISKQSSNSQSRLLQFVYSLVFF